ncbi:hypothetical protein HDV63DRAFT_402789 [Trichoderma sp. SZMC 28014]
MLTTTTINDGSQRTHLHDGDSISRFLADRDQRPPIVFSPVQTQGEAEAAGEARMFENLRAFDVRFGGGYVKSEHRDNGRAQIRRPGERFSSVEGN